MKKDLCLVDGEYCPYFPKQKIPERMTDISDGEILHESLRQRCVYEVTRQDDEGTVGKWFQYQVAYVDNCLDKTIFGEQCAVAQMKKVGINDEKVSRCV